MMTMRDRVQNKFYVKRVVGILLLALPWTGSASTVTSIDFNQLKSASEIQIQTDSPVSFNTQENVQENKKDKQIILEIKGTKLGKTTSRNMDTSSFDSPVVLISPYAVNSGLDSRIVVQLREMKSPQVTQSGNLLRILIPNSGSEGTDSGASTGANVVPTVAQAGSLEVEVPVTSKDKAPTGNTKNLTEFMESQQTGRFVGKPITLQLRDAELIDVFRLIGDTSGFNIVVGDDVKGKVTLSLEDVPWDQALDLILKTQKLGAERNSNVLRIVTLAGLKDEKLAELAAKQAADASAPRVTRVFPISFAKLDDLTNMLNRFASSAPLSGAPGAISGALGAQAPAVQADVRTNSLVVRDTAENIEKMQKLIKILDTQTPQVMIEGKVVEATEGFSRSIGGSLGFGNNAQSGQYFTSFAGANPVDPLFSFSGGGTGVAASSAGAGAFGISPSLAFLPGNTRLNALLNISESENSVRIVSSPKAIVLDKEKANIVQSTPVLTLSTAQTANGPVSIPVISQANLSLDVTPTVTNEGSVLMQLSLSRDVPFPVTSGTTATTAVANRNISTRVLVESGSTLVMGGIYTMDQTKTSSGFPILRHIPILGALFGSDANTNNRTELLFFITPRVLNLKEAGLSG